MKQLEKNATDMLLHNYKIGKNNKVLIIHDLDCDLASIMKDSFANALISLGNHFEIVEFNENEESIDDLIENINNNYQKDDIVVLIQSLSFRVSKFRWRNELCSRGLKVVEFGHLSKILPVEYDTYVRSLTYDYPHYEKLAKKYVPMLENAKEITIISENGAIAKYVGQMDKIVLNDGNFTDHTNFGSRFPIGEILTEGLDLSILNGEIEVYAFPNDDQLTCFTKPFSIKIENGFAISHNGPKDFDKIFEMIKTEHPEGKVYVREFGMGINRYIKRYERLGDPIAYERQEGLHFSLGMKHGIYQKKLWPKYGKKFYQRYHVDIYVNMDKMYIDDELVYEKDKGYLL